MSFDMSIRLAAKEPQHSLPFENTMFVFGA